MKFFFDKLTFLKHRYETLHTECLQRGFHVTHIWPQTLPDSPDLWKDYIPTDSALAENRERIRIRMPKVPRFTQKQP